MKTLAVLIGGVIAGVAVAQVSNPAASSSSAPAAAAASASAPSAGTGTMVHPISKNITARLANSPRHFDIVKIKHDDREVETYVFYPMTKDKAMAVILIHEIFGLSDWMRAAGDQLAEAGYIVLVPDLLSEMSASKGGTNDFPDSQVTRAVQSLDQQKPGQVIADLNAVAEYAKKLPSCNGNIAVGGFCWGGGKAFAFAAANKDLKAAFVFYGAPMLPEADMPKVNCPVYGFYGEADARISAAVPAETAAMKAAGKTYDAVVYSGAQHGFMRLGQMDAPLSTASDAVKKAYEDNKKASEDSWKRWLEILKKIDAPADAKPAAGSGTK